MFDADPEPTAPPKLPPEAFESLAGTLASAGPAAAADRLGETLRAAGDYDALFYARLLKRGSISA